MSERTDFEIWCVDLAAARAALAAVERATPRLSAADLQRAAAFSDPAVRAEWLAAHTALRLLIERARGVRWRNVPFAREAHGRPYLEGASLAFSLSHTAGMALIALAASGPVGVDIERMRSVRIGADRRARILEAGAGLAASPLPGADEARFLQAWVRLEALAKAEGCGVGRLLTRLGIFGAGSRAPAEAGQTAARAAALLSAAPPRRVGDLQLGDGIFAAVAHPAAAPLPAVYWLPAGAGELEKLVN